MTAYIQSLLFEPNNMKYPNILDNVSELMLSDQMKKKYLKDSDICDSSDNDEKIQNEVSHDNDRDYIKPKQKD